MSVIWMRDSGTVRVSLARTILLIVLTELVYSRWCAGTVQRGPSRTVSCFGAPPDMYACRHTDQHCSQAPPPCLPEAIASISKIARRLLSYRSRRACPHLDGTPAPMKPKTYWRGRLVCCKALWRLGWMDGSSCPRRVIATSSVLFRLELGCEPEEVCPDTPYKSSAFKQLQVD